MKHGGFSINVKMKKITRIDFSEFGRREGRKKRREKYISYEVLKLKLFSMYCKPSLVIEKQVFVF